MILKRTPILLILSLFLFFSCDECPTEADNNPPTTPVITASVTTVESDGQVMLVATSTDEDGDSINYLWAATGGSFNTTSGSNVMWTAPTVTDDQTFTITIEVKDDNFGTASASINILVTATGGGGNGGDGSAVIIGSDDNNIWEPFGGAAETDQDQWHDYNFNSNFTYNGSDNLLAVFERNSPGGGGSAVGVYGFDTPGVNRIMAVSNPANTTGIPHDYAMYIKLLFQ